MFISNIWTLWLPIYEYNKYAKDCFLVIRTTGMNIMLKPFSLNYVMPASKLPIESDPWCVLTSEHFPEIAQVCNNQAGAKSMDRDCYSSLPVELIEFQSLRILSGAVYQSKCSINVIYQYKCNLSFGQVVWVFLLILFL